MFERSYYRPFLFFVVANLGLIAACAVYSPQWLWLQVVLGPAMIIGIYDITQIRRALPRNFPVIGRLRFFMEELRPELRQYFIENDTDGTPFSRQHRSIVYQRSKQVEDTLGFGALVDMYEDGHEWVDHSLFPTHVDPETLRVVIGGKDCKQPYSASIYNISAMSYGALSNRAIEALNGGAAMGNFAHNTGEGGISSYHLRPGGDLIWQIGTGYFGCRTKDGGFDAKRFEEQAQINNVKMIEIKLSQGAKPGQGGVLPGPKVTEEIAEIRGIEPGKRVVSPPSHSAFNSPDTLVQFIQQLRELSGGKPVGIKMCVGNREEVRTLVQTMVKLNSFPDFITVDGSEGGTGAAPYEFATHVGTPLGDGLPFLHDLLKEFGVRDQIKLISSGKIASGFALIRYLAMGADLCSAARPFMLSLGCIQALKCNKNVCPVGIATTNPELVRGIHVQHKTKRVYNFHKETIKIAAKMIGAMGLEHVKDLEPKHIMRKCNNGQVKSWAELASQSREPAGSL